MAETPSTMIPLGTHAPSFSLLDTTTHKTRTLNELQGRLATVIMFLCNHCPYVKLIQAKLIAIAQEYQSKGVQFIAISSNDAEKYPQDGPDKMHVEALRHHYPFPYLYDESQEVAKAYQAACTPDFFVFDEALKCAYRGRFDEATPGNGKEVTGKDLKAALDALIIGEAVSPHQIASVGCNIKWRK